ncbi:MAG: hypothetical protein U5J98_05450 [Halobacteriales archaeon]|nr:hypothetical protein [Halobacteriales archaeon]
MERTPRGTSVGVDDPYAHAGRCDHLTDDGRCRLAAERPGVDLGFARARAAEDYACPVGAGDWDWADCPQFRSRSTAGECARCGLEERRNAHEDDRPLLEAHHLSYADAERLAHEITVHLCRWCHAKVHGSWARIDDDVAPDPEALAAREGRRSRELDELEFQSAADRRDG